VNVDERLRETLHERAAAVEPSPGGWTAITGRIERGQRRARTARLSLVGALSLASVVLAVALVTVTGPDRDDQQVAAEGGTGRPLGPTTTAPSPLAAESTDRPLEGGSGEAPGDRPGPRPGPLGPAAATGSPDGDTGMLSSGFHVGSVWPETAAELETIQAQVDAGHQPWWIDPAMVAAAYLADRGLVVSDADPPRSIGGAGVLRHRAGGVGGWVSVGQLMNGSIRYVEGSRSDRIVQLRVERQGDRLAVDVTVTDPGRVTVRTKRPGGDWNQGATQAVGGGQRASLTVDGPSGTDLIVQVRHEGDDGGVGLSDQRLGAAQPVLEYEGLHDGSTVGPLGLGPVFVGMPLAEAERFAGILMYYERGEHCTLLAPVGRPGRVAFASTRGDDRVDVITVGNSGVRTAAGIGVGSTVAEVRHAYPGIEERLTDGRGRLIQGSGEVTSGFEMVLVVVDDRVVEIWSGTAGLGDTDELCA
jgi:hypothetical protein